jgi:hypothetical protein
MVFFSIRPSIKIDPTVALAELECFRVLRQHRYEITDPVVAAEAGEERDRGLDHAYGFGHHAGATAEPGQPMSLAGMVALDAVRLLLADVQPPRRDQFSVGRPIVRAVEACAPTLDALE